MAYGNIWKCVVRVVLVFLLITCSFVLMPAARAADSSDRGIVAWGWNDFGQCNVPSPNSGFTAITAGSICNLGLKTDGTVAAWGSNGYGQCSVPSPNSGFAGVALGWYHSVGLKSDGSIVQWGDDTRGQLDNFPDPNSGFTAIAAGYYHSLGLKSDGSIVAWGSNGSGQCNVPAPNSNFVAVAAGGYHSLGLKSDGSVVAWGSNGYGACNVPAPNNGFIDIAGGGFHSVGLKSDGSIVQWGDSTRNQLDNFPNPNTGFVDVTAENHFSAGLKSDGSIVAWGNNEYGQCDVPAPNSGFTAVAAGAFHCVGLKNNYAVTASVFYTGHGSVSPASQKILYGSNASVDLVPNAGYHAAGIYDNGLFKSVTDPYVITGVTEDHEVLAVFEKNVYTVTTAVSGSGTAEGGGDYGYGSTVTVTATPDEGWHFVRWTEGGSQVSTDPTYSFTVIANRALTAVFAADPLITSSAGTGGSITPAGAVSVGYGADQSFTVTPSAGYHVADVVVDSDSQGAITSYTFTYVTASHTISASFALDSYAITASIFHTGHGAVNVLTPAVGYGGTATVDLVPDTGYHVAGIYDNGLFKNVADPYVITDVTADHEVLVVFEKNTYAVTTATSGNGTAEGGGDYGYGSTVTVTATPDDGRHFVNWTEGGAEISTDPTYSFTVTASCDLTANFAIDTCTVTASVADSGGTVSPATQTVDWGTGATVTLTPEARWHVASITDNGTPVPVANPYVIEDVTEAHEVVATFAPDTRTWYLAEGSTGNGFETWVLVENVNPDPVTLNVTFATAEGLVAPAELQGYELAANTRASFNAGSYVQAWDLATIVSSEGGDIVAERAMYGNERTWANCSVGTEIPASTWYLAEGCTGEGFETWVLVFNPGDDPVSVDLTLMTSAGELKPEGLADVAIPAHSRRSFNLGEFVTDYDVSTLVASTSPVVAERSMYGAERTWATCSIGTPAPATTWYLAEGSTGEGFETWVLVQNPNDTAVTVDLALVTSSGELKPEALTGVSIPAASRRTFRLNDYLIDYDVSTVVTSSAGVVCERAAYDTGRTWATCSIGASTPATLWYLAEGSTGEGFETWVLVQNPGDTPVSVDLSFATSAGIKAGPQDVVIPARSRRTFNLGDYLTSYDVSTMVTSTGPVVCERAMYGQGRTWAHDSVGWAP